MNAIASEAVSNARTMLNAAIRAGKDTLAPRKELTEAQQAAEREKAANDRLLAQMEKARADAIAKSVNAECSKLTADILAECQAVLPGYEVDISIESHRLVMLLEARARHDEIQAARDELAHDIETLQCRLADVESQIAAIHASGDRGDAAMGRVHVLGLDRSDIQALIEAASSQLEELTLPAMADLERGWRDAQLAARFKARHQVMVEMEKRLLVLATEARDVLGPGNWPDLRYRPSAIMRQAAQATII
ncbi:MAG: hypothetical protein RLZZ09_1818 [Pseudomonadota bacterium]